MHLELQDDALRQASISGLLLGIARRSDSDVRSTSLDTVGGGEAHRRAVISAGAIDLVRELVDGSAELSHADTLGGASSRHGRRGAVGLLGLGCQGARTEGIRGLLGVAKGSEQEPKLIHLEYRPEDPATRIALVGKGVTFDAGGINLKPDRDGLSYMKFDMAGGATVMGCMMALGELGVRAQVDGLIPAAANLPGPHAILPGDVIRQYGGATTEVTDTDSEGRLLR